MNSGTAITTYEDGAVRYFDQVMKYGVVVNGKAYLLSDGYVSHLDERDFKEHPEGDPVDFCGRSILSGIFQLHKPEKLIAGFIRRCKEFRLLVDCLKAAQDGKGRLSEVVGHIHDEWDKIISVLDAAAVEFRKDERADDMFARILRLEFNEIHSAFAPCGLEELAHLGSRPTELFNWAQALDFGWMNDDRRSDDRRSAASQGLASSSSN